jgi:N-ethylmaleimide reductase
LVHRIAIGAPLAPGDEATFYSGDARGYVDYPRLDEAAAA